MSLNQDVNKQDVDKQGVNNQDVIYSTLALEDPYYNDIIEDCIAELPGYVTRLEQHLKEGEQEESVRLSHSIKGSAGSHGFLPVATVAAQVERHAREGDLTAAQECLGALRELLPRLRTTPEEHLA